MSETNKQSKKNSEAVQKAQELVDRAKAAGMKIADATENAKEKLLEMHSRN